MMSLRFLHTSDWQLGMTRHFLSEGAQERYSQARFDAIRTMGRVAKDENCRFMLVCGDAFESNQNDSTLVEWLRHCKRSGLYEQGKLLYEKGGLNPDTLAEESMVNVEEDYQVCVRILARAGGVGTEIKPKRGRKV